MVQPDTQACASPPTACKDDFSSRKLTVLCGTTLETITCREDLRMLKQRFSMGAMALTSMGVAVLHLTHNGRRLLNDDGVFDGSVSVAPEDVLALEACCETGLLGGALDGSEEKSDHENGVEIAEQALAKRRKKNREWMAINRAKEGTVTKDARRAMQRQQRQSKRRADDDVLALEASCEKGLLGTALDEPAEYSDHRNDATMQEIAKEAQKKHRKKSRDNMAADRAKEGKEVKQQSNKRQTEERQTLSMEAKKERKQKQYERNTAARSKETKEEKRLRLLKSQQSRQQKVKNNSDKKLMTPTELHAFTREDALAKPESFWSNFTLDPVKNLLLYLWNCGHSYLPNYLRIKHGDPAMTAETWDQGNVPVDPTLVELNEALSALTIDAKLKLRLMSAFKSHFSLEAELPTCACCGIRHAPVQGGLEKPISKQADNDSAEDPESSFIKLPITDPVFERLVVTEPQRGTHAATQKYRTFFSHKNKEYHLYPHLILRSESNGEPEVILCSACKASLSKKSSAKSAEEVGSVIEDSEVTTKDPPPPKHSILAGTSSGARPLPSCPTSAC